MIQSVTNFNGVNYDYDFVGFKNYMTLFREGTLVNSIKNTLIYAVIMVLGSNLLGLVLAMALNVKLRGKAFSGLHLMCRRCSQQLW